MFPTITNSNVSMPIHFAFHLHNEANLCFTLGETFLNAAKRVKEKWPFDQGGILGSEYRKMSNKNPF